MLTKDQFIQGLEPLKCSICLDDYSGEHVPVQLSCGHIFGDHCIVVQAETATLNNNRCPLCRQELFDQEDTEAAENALYESDELAYDNYDDEMGGEEGIMDEEAFQEAIDALLNDYESDERAHGPGSSAPEIEEATNRRQEFREHAARRRNMGRTTVAKSPGRTRTYTQIEASDVETDADWSGSEYEPEDDSDPADEREEKRTYRLLPGEYGT